MAKWKAVVDNDGNPANAKQREDEMYLSSSRKGEEKAIGFVWRDVGGCVRARTLGVSADRRIDEFIKTDSFDDAAKLVCQSLDVPYVAPPAFKSALAASRSDAVTLRAARKAAANE